jgi:hypothetical protein
VKIVLRKDFSYNSQNCTAVFYAAQTLSGNKIISTRGVIVAYNKKGEVYFRSENLDLDLGQPQITDDGRYLCCLTGGYYGEGRTSNVTPGCLVLDLQNGKILHFEQGNNFNGIGFIGCHYFGALKNLDKVKACEYEILNCDEKITHSLRLTFEKSSELMEQTCTGFKFKDKQTGKVYYKLYNPDFITKKMQIDEK